MLVAAIVLGVALRFLWIDADPSVFKHVGDVGDEGYWALAARNLTLFGTYHPDEYVQAAVAPLFTAFVWPAYAVFGVTLAATRLPSAVCAAMTVALIYVALRPLDRKAALIAAALLAVDHKYFIYSRVGHVEVALGGLLLAAYLQLSRRAYVTGGLLFGAAVATKLTAFWMVLPFALFLGAQWLRKECRATDVLRTAFGAAVVGLPLGAWMWLNAAMLAPTYRMLATRGVAILTEGPHAFVDFVMSLTLGYPSIVLQLALLGVYLQRIDATALIGPRWRQALQRLTSADLIALSWLVGYSIAVIFFSDMNNRRLNFFFVPMAMVAGLLVIERRASDGGARTVVQDLLSWSPVALLGTIVGQRLLDGRSPAPFVIAAIASVIGIALLAWRERHRGARFRWRNPVRDAAWVLTASLSCLNMMRSFVLPQLGVSGVIGMASLIGVLVVAVAVTWLSTRRLTSAFALMATVNVLLIGADLTHRSFATRDASRQLAALAGPTDSVMGTMAFELSFEGRFHSLLWWPAFGINSTTAAKTHPRFLVRDDGEPSDAPRTAEENALRYPDPRNAELRAIGVTAISPRMTVGLYPVRGVPRARLTVYELSY